jgi:DUF1365 family protein
MAISAQLLNGQVMHKRLSPKVNAFKYGIYYVCLPLSSLREVTCGRWFGINRRSFNSLYNEDHGARDGSDLLLWIKKILYERNAGDIDGEVVLVTMPRTLGYVFNPISFWLCYDAAGVLRAVLCEVCNTFGENHSYLCLHEDHREIRPEDIFESDKVFHVSPFLKREGRYTFRFTKTEKSFGAWIDYEEKRGEKKLLTMLTGSLEPWSEAGLRGLFWRYPLVSLRAVGLIHWQALKLLAKGIRYVPKPAQLAERLSRGADYK